MALLGIRCCTRAFSSCGERGLLFVAVRGLLIVVASLVAEHRLQVRGLQQLWLAGSRVQAQQLSRTGLVAPRHVGSSPTRAQTHVPCIGRRIVNHCATREVSSKLNVSLLEGWTNALSQSSLFGISSSQEVVSCLICPALKLGSICLFFSECVCVCVFACICVYLCIQQPVLSGIIILSYSPPLLSLPLKPTSAIYQLSLEIIASLFCHRLVMFDSAARGFQISQNVCLLG